jgi:hypothetical protein
MKGVIEGGAAGILASLLPRDAAEAVLAEDASRRMGNRAMRPLLGRGLVVECTECYQRPSGLYQALRATKFGEPVHTGVAEVKWTESVMVRRIARSYGVAVLLWPRKNLDGDQR